MFLERQSEKKRTKLKVGKQQLGNGPSVEVSSGVLLLQDKFVQFVGVLACFHPNEHGDRDGGVLLVHGGVWDAHDEHIVFPCAATRHVGSDQNIQQYVA